MNTMTEPTTVKSRLEQLVAADLADYGVTLVLSADWQTRGDAWCDATDEHGPRVALIHLTDGRWINGRPVYVEYPGDRVPARELHVDYQYGDDATGRLIAETLKSHGFTVEWNGNGGQTVTIKL